MKKQSLFWVRHERATSFFLLLKSLLEESMVFANWFQVLRIDHRYNALYKNPHIFAGRLNEMITFQSAANGFDLRDAEKETYQAHGGNFDEDERYFRCGFEAAQHSANRGKSYEECRARLGDGYPDAHEREPFQRGYKRGRAYFEALRQRATTSKQ